MIIVRGLAITSFIDLSSLLNIASFPEEFLLFNLLIIDSFAFSNCVKIEAIFSGTVKVISEI